MSVMVNLGNTRGQLAHATSNRSGVTPASDRSRTAAARRPRSFRTFAGPRCASRTAHNARLAPPITCPSGSVDGRVRRRGVAARTTLVVSTLLSSPLTPNVPRMFAERSPNVPEPSPGCSPTFAEPSAPSDLLRPRRRAIRSRALTDSATERPPYSVQSLMAPFSSIHPISAKLLQNSSAFRAVT